jgi:transcriptional regulator with PAS, ATPase and Fis domain
MPADAPFVEINCAALPEHLIESELFGYEKGAFTHAVTSKPGLLEEARGGTLFLDEIGEMPLNMQAKLLNALETKQFRRLGSTKSIETDLRVIAATNRHLHNDVDRKRFREDLFYRLNVVSITMPPLRELGSDILLISEYLLKLFNVEFKKDVKGFTEDARQLLLNYSWPGNVRELSNCLERAMIFTEHESLDATDLVIFSPQAQRGKHPLQQWVVPPGGIILEEVERQLILSALQQSDHNKSKAARLLGLTRDTLRYRLDKYQIS